MLDTSNAVHAWSFSALTVFTWARKPNKPTRRGIPQEWWCHLWWSRFWYYLCANLTFGDQLREWQARHIRPLLCSGSFRRSVAPSLYYFVVAGWHICDWRIGYKPQSTIFHTIYCQSCKGYVSWSCLMLHYQRRTGIYTVIPRLTKIILSGITFVSRNVISLGFLWKIV